MFSLRSSSIAFVIVSSLGCGYCRAGTWENEAKNWERAFGSPKPVDVVVLRSRYEHGFHWSEEFSYFFEIAPSATLERLARSDGMIRVQDEGPCVGPPWFLPKPTDQYKIWGYADQRSDFRVFIDLQTQNIFLSDCIF